jgi:hypothetical protein
MRIFQSAAVIHRRLEDLAEALELEGDKQLDLLVCGGAALTVMGLVTRATDDIDVLALVLDEKDVAAKPFPEELVKATQRVARTRGLPAKWLNPGPADMQEFGLPDGIVGRASKKEYGKVLTVRFLDRYDQIHLKLYAAVDMSGGKHLSDLEKLAPTTEELVDAARWCVQQDPSEGFRGLLEWFLSQEGYEDVVERISK